MAHTHEFDCKICGAHLDSREELEQHRKKQHTAQASSPSNPNVNASDSGLDRSKPKSL